MLAPVTPTVVPLLTALAPVNVTVPKLAKATCDPPDSKSSTIHSALYSQREPREASLEKVWVTVFPVVLFVIFAVPPVLEEAVTVTVTLLPAGLLVSWRLKGEGERREFTCKGDAAEVVGVVWVPLIPSIIGNGGTGFCPVDTSLQDSSAASVTIDTDPSRSGTSSGWSWDSESSVRRN